MHVRHFDILIKYVSSQWRKGRHMILSGINSSNTKAGKAEPKQQTANHFHRDEGDTGDTDKAKKLENHIEQQIWCHKVLSHVSPSSL
jgi:hypothetical protein